MCARGAPSGLSSITLVFRDGIEDYWSRHRIRERIQDVPLPPGLTPGLDPLSSPTGQIFKYTLESDTKGLRELSELQKWTVIPALKQVPGIADIENFGGITTQFQLELDPQQLIRSTCRARTSPTPSAPTAPMPVAASWRAVNSVMSFAASV